MPRRHILPLIAAAALAAAAPALAQSVDLPAHINLNLAGFSGDPGTLPAVITTIEGASGGQVVEIRFNNVSGVPGYDVILAQGSQIKFLRFTKPGGGPITLTEKTEPAWMLNWSGRQDVSLVRTAKVKLPDAVRAAEAARGNSPAVAAGMARSASGADTSVRAYNVAILKDGEQRRVAVDSETGEVIANPAMLGELQGLGRALRNPPRGCGWIRPSVAWPEPAKRDRRTLASPPPASRSLDCPGAL